MSKAFELMNQAAKAGDGEAMYRLSLMYRGGRGVVRDVAMADQWLAKSRKTSFDPRSAGFTDDAPSNMGPRGATRVDIDSLERRAKAGDGQSMYELGVHLITGRDVPKDEKKGFTWLERAAKAGHADAMNDVGCCYFYGKCVRKDPALAREWLTRAANAGSSRAQRAIAGARGGAGWKELSDEQKKQALGLFLLALAATSGSSGEARTLACRGSGALFDCSCDGFVPGGLYDNPDPFTCRRCIHPKGDHSR